MHRPVVQAAALLHGPAASEPASLPRWESLMRDALLAERHGSAALALAGYESAAHVALDLLDAPAAGREEDCVAAFVASHLNLADLLAATGDTAASARHLCHAHDTLIALQASAQRPPSVRRAALRHSRETHVALIRHLARHGHDAHVARSLEAAESALQGDATARH
jgi:hypothetical protein